MEPFSSREKVTSSQDDTATRTVPRNAGDSLIAFPERRVRRVPSHNLPHDLTSFIGRESEVEGAAKLLSENRLSTITGSGGSGKTRLALAVARRVAEDFDGGVWFVELAPLPEPSLVVRAVAEAMSVREKPGSPLEEAILDHLRSRETFIVMDNCEHLIEECARFARDALTSCAGLRVMATSREPLGVDGEASYRVPPLSAPEGSEDASRIEGFEAVRLFVERAKARSSDFRLTEGNSASVAEICRRLEGMPLAIELAAARLPVLSEAQISQRLGDSLSLLATGGRASSPRQRTIRATLEWSHDLLDEDERSLLRKLSVFAGGFTLEAAEVFSGEAPVLDVLGRLVDKSLVSPEAGPGDVRYSMLEPIRQFGRGKLEECGEEGVARRLHAGYFLALAEGAEPEICGPEQGVWMKRLEAEHDNLRAAMAFFEEGGDFESGFRLGGALWRFWWLRGRFAEGRSQVESLLELPGADAPTEARAKALYALGVLACRQADHTSGSQARAYDEESLHIYRSLGDKPRAAATLRELGRVSIELGDWKTADSFLEESLNLERDTGNEYGVALTMNSLGWLAHFRGGNDAARRHFEEARVVFRRFEDDLYRDICSFFLGRIATDEGDFAKARALLASTVDERLPQYLWAIPPLLEAFAGLAAAEKDAARSLELAGAGAALREEIGASHAPAWKKDITRRLAPAWRKLGKRSGESAWQKGREMSPEEAIEYAMENTESRSEPLPGGLTKREVEVLRHLASGETNKEIAAGLVVSEATVGRHVANVYKKIGAHGRAEATAYAMGEGIV